MKMGLAATLAPKGLGPQSPTKKWARWLKSEWVLSECVNESKYVLLCGL